MALTFDTSNILKNVAVATEYFKAYYGIVYQNTSSNDDGSNPTQKFSGGTNGFIPFNIDFTVDGISGIKIYNKLTINTSFLSNGYTRTTDFIVTGVDHKLIDHDWVTNIKTTLIPKFQDSDKVITAQNFASIKFQNSPKPPKPPVISTDDPANTGNYPTLTTSEAFNDPLLWMYMIHQQGPDGSIQLYKIWKGTQEKWKSNVPIGNLIKTPTAKGNWPGGYEWDGFSMNDGYEAYYGRGKGTQAMATAFIGVWTKMMVQKREAASELINSNGKNCSGLSYKNTLMPAFRNAIQKVKEENPTWDVFDPMTLATIANIENGLSNNTRNSIKYQGMFQQDRTNDTYAAILNKYNDGTPTNPACTTEKASYLKQTQYGVSNFEGYALESFRIIMKNWEKFKTQVNWEGN